MTITVPTTPANYFHLLRRHVLDDEHKPLVVFTPKSMLRLRAATSSLAEFTSGAWQPVIPDVEAPPGDTVHTVLLCSGKVYYDLRAARAKTDGGDGFAIVRVEQPYPLPLGEILGVLSTYPAATDVVWIQEEPANQGAWPFMAVNLPGHLGDRRLRSVSRRAMAAPAGGSGNAHEAEQRDVVSRAFERA
jgi:2-oxoglutarate dehydrogenase E1 component